MLGMPGSAVAAPSVTVERLLMPVLLNGASEKRQENRLAQYIGKWDFQVSHKKIATQIQVITSKQINLPWYS